MALTDTLPAGVTFDSATPVAGHLHRVERHGHLRARDDRRRGRARPSRSRSRRRTRARSPTRRASPPTSPIPIRPTRTASAETTVRPVADLVADEDRRPGPGAGGPAAHLHAHRRQLGAAQRHRRAAHRHPARARRRSSPPRRRRAAARRRAAPSPARSARSRTRASASVEIKVTPQEGGTITNQATVSSDERRPDPREQLRQRRDDRRTRPPTSS